MKKKDVKIAVVGATGMVGNAMLSILDEFEFPMQNVTAIASQKSAGASVSYGESGVLNVVPLDDFDFSNTDIALFSPGGDISKIYAPKAAGQGCVVIDNTSYFRMHPDVPLVIPEINPDALSYAKKTNIISNPNCSTIQLLMALKPIHDMCGIKRVVVSTYQSVSGAGTAAMEELFSQTRNIAVNQAIEKNVFHKPIAFNVLPQIDVFMEDGSTKEEWKMIVETKKILDPKIKISATCVRVPVYIGHGVSVNVECERDFEMNDIRTRLSQFRGVRMFDDPDELRYATPVDCAGENDVYVSRLREDPSLENGLNFWVVCDNVRKGAALNAVQILELYIKKYM